MRLPFTVGFEMTGLVPGYKEHPEENELGIKSPDISTQLLNRAMSTCIGAELAEKYPKDFEIQEYTDGHCIEFASPVFQTIEAMDEFYKFVKKQFDKFQITPHHPVTVCGGNHWHFGLSNQIKIRNILRDFTNWWSVPWVFTQPDDTISCNGFLADKSMYELQVFVKMGGRIDESTFSDPNNIACFKLLTTDQRIHLSTISSFKDMCIGTNLPKTQRTLEFRCAEAPKSFSEFKDQQEFFMRYFAYALKLKSVPPITFISKEELQKVTPEAAHFNFQKLLKLLRLEPTRYEKYVHRNLYPRWEQGRERS